MPPERAAIVLRVVLIAILVVAGLFVAFGFVIPAALESSLTDRGLLGDSFGVVNALFSGLAFAGLILAIWLQSIELRLQREELKLTRDELKRHGDALTAQVNAAANQRFDSTFFQMVSLHHQIVNALTLNQESNHPPLVGREVLTTLNQRIRSEVDDVAKDLAVGTTPDELRQQMGQIAAAYQLGYEQFEHLLGHYFRNLYRIVKFVDSADIENPSTYIGLIRAQLSSAELQLIFYNLFGPGRTKFLPLAEKHDLLDNLRYQEVDPSHYQVIWKYRASTGPDGWRRLELDGAPETP